MAEYIDKEKLLDFLQMIPIDLGYREIEDVKQFVKEMPTADVVERKRGKWLDDGLDGIGVMGIEYRWQKCSECGKTFSKAPGIAYPKYCSQCGAKMEVLERCMKSL